MAGGSAKPSFGGAGGMGMMSEEGTSGTGGAAAAAGADLVLMCVKTPDTEAATREIAPHLAPDAIVLSLQNN